MSTVSTAFPDQTYSSGNKPSADTLKADIQALETGHNELETRVVSASTSAAGLVELATTAETTTGTDATRAVTPDGLHDMTSLSGAAWFLDEDTMSSDSATKVPSQQSVKAYIDTAVATAKSALFPVGSIYTAIVSTNPGTLLGFGTWTAFGAGRTLVGLDSGQTEFDTVEETGGAKTHTLTEAELPSGAAQKWYGTRWTGDFTGTPIGNDVKIGFTDSGSGSAHNNLQPYIVVYFWKRTA